MSCLVLNCQHRIKFCGKVPSRESIKSLLKQTVFSFSWCETRTDTEKKPGDRLTSRCWGENDVGAVNSENFFWGFPFVWHWLLVLHGSSDRENRSSRMLRIGFMVERTTFQQKTCILRRLTILISDAYKCRNYRKRDCRNKNSPWYLQQETCSQKSKK